MWMKIENYSRNNDLYYLSETPQILALSNNNLKTK